jgi:hypothetical protein
MGIFGRPTGRARSQRLIEPRECDRSRARKLEARRIEIVVVHTVRVDVLDGDSGATGRRTERSGQAGVAPPVGRGTTRPGVRPKPRLAGPHPTHALRLAADREATGSKTTATRSAGPPSTRARPTVCVRIAGVDVSIERSVIVRGRSALRTTTPGPETEAVARAVRAPKPMGSIETTGTWAVGAIRSRARHGGVAQSVNASGEHHTRRATRITGRGNRVGGRPENHGPAGVGHRRH